MYKITKDTVIVYSEHIGYRTQEYYTVTEIDGTLIRQLMDNLVTLDEALAYIELHKEIKAKKKQEWFMEVE